MEETNWIIKRRGKKKIKDVERNWAENDGEERKKRKGKEIKWWNYRPKEEVDGWGKREKEKRSNDGITDPEKTMMMDGKKETRKRDKMMQLQIQRRRWWMRVLESRNNERDIKM